MADKSDKQPDDDPGGFLTRWSRRKVQVRQGVALPEPVVTVAGPPPAVLAAAPAAVLTPAAAEAAQPPRAPAPPPAPTLADVAMLGRDSDYTRFVAPGVDAGVKNAALKKLFSDPHFNVMDGLDTYIDDYGKPDPLPEGMLRKMAQSHFLGLFDDEKKTADETVDDGVKTAQSDHLAPHDPAAAAPPEADPTSLEPEPDEDADLRLQPHDAAGPTGPGQGPGPDAGRQR